MIKESSAGKNFLRLSIKKTNKYYFNYDLSILKSYKNQANKCKIR
jgi:hypothetical protein